MQSDYFQVSSVHSSVQRAKKRKCNHHTVCILHKSVLTVRVLFIQEGKRRTTSYSATSAQSLFFQKQNIWVFISRAVHVTLKAHYLQTHSSSELKGNTFFTKKWLILSIRKRDQQNHMKSLWSQTTQQRPKGSLSVSLCPPDHNSQDAEWQRRLRKQFSLEKCYTLIKKKVLHITERNCGYQVLFLPTVIYFICSRSLYLMDRDFCCECVHMGFSSNNWAV